MDETLNHARAVLETAGIEVTETRELPNGLGHQLRCTGGQIVVAYRSGTVVAQGKDTARVKALFAAAPAAQRPTTAAARPKPPAPPAAATASFTPRFPPGWTTEPWDGVSVPWAPIVP